MILNKICLEDFVSHKKTEIDLDYGINVIVGPNGAGKTSILDGISFALFNDTCRGKKENIINSKANRCRVSLEFTEAGVQYEANWSLERRGSAKGGLFRLSETEKNLQVKGGERAVVSEIQKVLGIDKSMFLQSVYVRQGEIEELVTALPSARKALISRLLGVDELDRAWNSIKEVIDVYKDRGIALDAELRRKPVVEEEKDKALERLSELVKLLASKNAELAKVEADLKSLQQTLDELKEKKRQFDLLDREKGLLDQSLKGLESRLKTEKEELSNAIAAEKIIKDLEEDVKKLPIIEAYVADFQEKEKLELKKQNLKQKLDEIAELEKTIKSNSEKHAAYLEKQKQIADKTKERRLYEGADTALSAAKRQLGKLRDEANKRERLLAKELEKCATSLGEVVSVETIESVADKVEKFLKDSLNNLDFKIDEMTSAKGALEQRILELEENISKLSSTTEAKACPTCETELGPERVSELLAKYASAKTTAQTDLSDINSDLGKTQEARGEVDRKLRQVSAVSSERVHHLALELEEAKTQVTSQESELVGLEKNAEILHSLTLELEKLEEEKSALEEAAKEFDAAKRRIDSLPSKESLEEEVAPIESGLKELARSLAAHINALGYQPEDASSELKVLQKRKEEFDQNLPTAKRRGEYESLVLATDKEISECKNNRSDVIRKIEELDYDAGLHDEVQRNFDSKNKAVVELGKVIAGLKADKAGAEAEAEKYGLELDALREKASEKKLLDKYIAVLNRIRDAYGKDGIQKMIRARAKPLLEKATRDLFERFNLAYSDVKIDEDYNISVIGPAGEQDIDQISGGERVALAIALRLAIAQVLSGKIETIIMDEPTTHLDEQRRKELVSILSSFFREGGRIIPQMLIITHHPEIEDVADTIYTVRKEDGFSIAEKNTLSNS
jgi:exonuclease SbcC